MAPTETAVVLPTVCCGCNRSGPYRLGQPKRPRWCRCKGTPGMLQAPAGHVTVFHFRSKEAERFVEECRLAGNAEREARDALSFRFVRCGRGWRELRRSSPTRRRLERAYRSALRRLRACQARCAHPVTERSLYDLGRCGVCYASVAQKGAA